MNFKKTVTSLLAAVFLLSATEAGELFKIPLLVEHYYDHKLENKQTGLISFLVQHYATEDGTDKDAAEDRQLPFKSAENVTVMPVVASIPSSSINITRPETPCPQTFISFNDAFVSSLYLDTIWQPPRHC